MFTVNRTVYIECSVARRYLFGEELEPDVPIPFNIKRHRCLPDLDIIQESLFFVSHSGLVNEIIHVPCGLVAPDQKIG